MSFEFDFSFKGPAKKAPTRKAPARARAVPASAPISAPVSFPAPFPAPALPIPTPEPMEIDPVEVDLPMGEPMEVDPVYPDNSVAIFPIPAPIPQPAPALVTFPRGEIKATRIDKEGRALAPRPRKQQASIVVPRRTCLASVFDQRPAISVQAEILPTRYRPVFATRGRPIVGSGVIGSAFRSTQKAAPIAAKARLAQEAREQHLAYGARQIFDDLSAGWKKKTAEEEPMGRKVARYAGQAAYLAVGLGKLLGLPFVGYLVMEALQH
ncbi:hypothetical protein ABW19_dt0208943 [Dactylella cylindrospora]|nr:hypothetical protein ABW19_dt0208943 [Dactylella cylindrospora]